MTQYFLNKVEVGEDHLCSNILKFENHMRPVIFWRTMVAPATGTPPSNSAPTHSSPPRFMERERACILNLIKYIQIKFTYIRMFNYLEIYLKDAIKKFKSFLMQKIIPLLITMHPLIPLFNYLKNVLITSSWQTEILNI